MEMRIGFAIVTILLAVPLFALRTYAADECDFKNAPVNLRAALERNCQAQPNVREREKTGTVDYMLNREQERDRSDKK
jgi:hypothetical protein